MSEQGTDTNVNPKCSRCGDMYYDPKTLIECEKQRAAEWEEIAKSKGAQLTKVRNALANLLLDSRLAGLSSIGNNVVFEARLALQNTHTEDES